MAEVLTESQCQILTHLASDSGLVLVKPPKAGFYFVVPFADAKAGRTERRVGHKFQAKVVDRLYAFGLIMHLVGDLRAFGLSERGKLAAKEIDGHTRNPTGSEALARRSVHARA
jgi:hypothetical protein